jgi:hypothetical protein
MKEVVAVWPHPWLGQAMLYLHSSMIFVGDCGVTWETSF